MPSISTLDSSDALAEIQRAQECVSAIRSASCTYHIERLKLVSSIGASPLSQIEAELAMALGVFDEKHLASQRQAMVDLLSNVA